jgi:DHA1 family inner membrane transport protein
MFTGLTLANILGVPLGTALGQEFGWRMTFWAVSVIGVLALAGLMFSLPEDVKSERETLRSEMTVLRHREVWQAFAMTVTFSAAMFTTFTYIAPFLEDLTGLSPRGVTSSLFLIGIGLTIGNVLGGRFADKRLQTTLIGGFAAIAVASLLLSVFATMMIPTEILLFVWGCVTFALVPALQVNVMKRGHEAPNLVSIMNIGAFNIGNALGAWTGGAVLDAEFGLQSVPVAAVVWAVAGVLLSLRRKEVAVTQI